MVMKLLGYEIALNRKTLLFLAGGVTITLVLLASYIWLQLNTPLTLNESPDSIEVQPGSSLTAVANDLYQRGLISSPGILTLYARSTGVAASIQTGEYELVLGITPLQLLDKMISGDTVQYRITLVEGWTLSQALQEIWNNPNIQRTLNGSEAELIADLLNVNYPSAEGLLYPDTYFFTKGSSDVEIITRANQRLIEVLEESWQNRLGALPLNNPYEALILASIIEKESAQGSERGHIAGAFVRRLEQGMRLQSDPTVIYGMGDEFDGDIRREDLREQTAYNTYRINGLPPTPIALAGIESIEASVNPLPSSYLYFVSRGDGTHQFSSTLEEHNAAVNQYQLQQ